MAGPDKYDDPADQYRNSPEGKVRFEYEDRIGKAKTEQEHQSAWQDYRGKMKTVSPETTLYPDQWKAQFPDKYPAYSGKEPKYAKGGIVGPNRLKWGSPKVSAPCKDSKTIKCY